MRNLPAARTERQLPLYAVAAETEILDRRSSRRVGDQYPRRIARRVCRLATPATLPGVPALPITAQALSCDTDTPSFGDQLSETGETLNVAAPSRIAPIKVSFLMISSEQQGHFLYEVFAPCA
jgi:hypothetical protein